MTSRPSQPWLQTSGLEQAIAAVGEEVLLDWVEGRLPPERIAALSQGPQGARLAATVRAMQGDRDTLTTLGTLGTLPAMNAPIDFTERVLETIDREALAALTQGPALEDHPPINIETYRARRATPSWAGPVAIAAGVALLVGGAGYFVALSAGLFSRGTPAGSGGPIALHDGTPASSDHSSGASPQGIAALQHGGDAAPGEPASATAALAAAEAATLDSAAETARLIALAREGRLVIRAVAREHGERIASVSPQVIAARDGAWKLGDQVDADVLAAVRPIMHESRAKRQEISRAMRSIATSRSGAPIPPEASVARPGRSVSDEAFVLDLDATPQAFEAACRALRERLGADVVFDTLPEPLPLALPADVGDMAWWNKPADHWSARLSIPLVVERD